MFRKIPFSILNRIPLKKVMSTLTEGVVPVFMLHRIEDKKRGVDGISPEKIDHFLDKMRRYGREFMGMKEFCNHLERPGGEIKNKALFTIDDGYLDQLEKGVPIFQKHNCPVSIAVITDFLSGEMWPWDAKVRYLFEMTKVRKLEFTSAEGKNYEFTLGGLAGSLRVMREVRENLKRETEKGLLEKITYLEERLEVELPRLAPERYRAFSWDDVKRLEGDGVNFIPHTRSHIILSNLTLQRAREEIAGSVDKIKSYIDPLPFFAYPNGHHEDYNNDHIKILTDNGIKAAFSTDYSYFNIYEFNPASSARFNVSRVSFPEDRFTQHKVASFLDCIQERYLKNTFDSLVETIYGTRRQLLSWGAENIFKWTYYKKYRVLDISKIKRIIFVCKGNICRSPFAEVVAKTEKARLPVVSMGFDASGHDKPEQSAIKIAKEFGYDMNSLCSSRLEDGLILDGDLVVVMEVSHLNKVKKLASSVDYQMTLLGVWDEKPMLSIFDPYGRSDARFRYVFTHINASVKNLLHTLAINNH